MFVALAAVVLGLAVWAIRGVTQWMSVGAVKEAFVDRAI